MPLQIEEGLKISLVATDRSGTWEPPLGFNPVETQMKPFWNILFQFPFKFLFPLLPLYSEDFDRVEQIKKHGNCLQHWGTFLWHVPELLLRGGGSQALAAAFTLEPCTSAQLTQLLLVYKPLPLWSALFAPASTPAWCRSQSAEFWIGVLFFFPPPPTPFSPLFIVCSMRKHLFTSRRKTIDTPGCCYHSSFMCLSLAGGPRAKMESTWLCDFTIEIKKSNMTEEACCLWNYRFQRRTSLPSRN